MINGVAKIRVLLAVELRENALFQDNVQMQRLNARRRLEKSAVVWAHVLASAAKLLMTVAIADKIIGVVILGQSVETQKENVILHQSAMITRQCA